MNTKIVQKMPRSRAISEIAKQQRIKKARRHLGAKSRVYIITKIAKEQRTKKARRRIQEAKLK